ncbi:MAG: TonB-dependent siderophore receptor [Gammaproteobacteria bacterium]|nr:TonB-dependent siderophore receptor [Gammaproteobacteria bacterium]
MRLSLLSPLARRAAALSLLFGLSATAADSPPAEPATGPAEVSAAPSKADAAVALDGVEVTGVKSLKPPAVNVGNKSGLPLERVPQSVQVLSADDLDERGVRSIGDALRAVPSANVGNPRVARYQSFSLKIRGFLADQQRNGLRQRYFEDVDASAISNIERIEVLKGPGGVLYGQSAVGGLLNLVTKAPQAQFGASANASFGSFDQKTLGFDVTGPISSAQRLYVRLTGEIERSGTYTDFQDLDRENLALGLSWQPVEAVTAHLNAEWHQRDTANNPGLPVTGTLVGNGVAELRRGLFLGEPNFTTLKAFAPLVQAWVDIRLSDDWTLTPRAQYSGFDTGLQQVRVLAPVAGSPTTINRNGREGRENDGYSVFQLDLAGRFETFGFEHRLLTGVEQNLERSLFTQFNLTNIGSIDALNPVYTYDSVAPELAFAFHAKQAIDTLAFYAQDTLALTTQWDLTGAVRQTRILVTSLFNDTVDATAQAATTFQVGSTFRVDERWSVYAGYNTGFDLENNAGSRTPSGDVAEPEESDQVEAGVRYASDSLRASAAIFRTRRKNFVVPDPVDPNVFTQAGLVRVDGIEFEGAWQATRLVQLQGGYAYLGAKVVRGDGDDSGRRLGDTPLHTANLRVEARAPSAWLDPKFGTVSLSATGAYVGSRTLTNTSAVELPDYGTLDLGLSWALRGLSAELFVLNASDNHYFTATGNSNFVYAGEPRTVFARVGWRY